MVKITWPLHSTVNAMITATNVTQYWQSVNIIITCLSRNNSRFSYLFGTYNRNGWPTLHCTCNNTEFTEYGLHRRMPEWGGGRIRTFPVLLVCRERQWAHSRPGFTVTMRTEVSVNTPHRAGTTSPVHWQRELGLLTEICVLFTQQKSTEKYTNNSIFPFLWPGVHRVCYGAVQISKRKCICGQFNMKLMINYATS